MSGFSVCSLGNQPAIKYHHNFGEFEFFILKDPKDEKLLTYACAPKINEDAGQKVLSTALENLRTLATNNGYPKDHQLNMYDILRLLSNAKVAGKK